MKKVRIPESQEGKANPVEHLSLINHAEELVTRVFNNALTKNLNQDENGDKRHWLPNGKVYNWLIQMKLNAQAGRFEMLNMLEAEELSTLFTQKEKETLELIAILHKLGNFDQPNIDVNTNQEMITNKTPGFRPDTHGAELLEQEELFKDNKQLLFAIEQSGQMQINEDSKYLQDMNVKEISKALLMTKAIRDISKLTNIKEFAKGNTYPFIAHLKPADTTPEFKEAFIKGADLSKTGVKGKSAGILYTLNWLNDINFKYTSKQISSVGFVDKAFKALEAYELTDEEISELKTAFLSRSKKTSKNTLGKNGEVKVSNLSLAINAKILLDEELRPHAVLKHETIAKQEARKIKSQIDDKKAKIKAANQEQNKYFDYMSMTFKTKD